LPKKIIDTRNTVKIIFLPIKIVFRLYSGLSEELGDLVRQSIDTREIIALVDNENLKEITFDNLSNLFRRNNLRPYDDELISF
jgi:hypothetical protein